MPVDGGGTTDLGRRQVQITLRANCHFLPLPIFCLSFSLIPSVVRCSLRAFRPSGGCSGAGTGVQRYQRNHHLCTGIRVFCLADTIELRSISINSSLVSCSSSVLWRHRHHPQEPCVRAVHAEIHKGRSEEFDCAGGGSSHHQELAQDCQTAIRDRTGMREYFQFPPK